MWEFVEYARSKNADETIEKARKLFKQDNNDFFLIHEENAKPDIYIQAKQNDVQKSGKLDMNVHVYQSNGRKRTTYIELRMEREPDRYERHLQPWFLGEGIGTNNIGCKKGKLAAYGRYRQLNEQYDSWRGEITITRFDNVGGKVEGTYKVYFSAGEGSNIVIAGGFRVTRSEGRQREKDPARINQITPNWCK